MILSAEDRARLAAIAGDRSHALKHVQRARIVLHSADRLPVLRVARRAGVSRPAVWRWQRRFAEEGVEGLLRDKTRPPGKPPLAPEVVARVLTLTAQDPPGEATKFWLSSLPQNTSLDELVAVVKRRWRIERDYRELKQEIGLGHYEGRGWRGFHHHATLCIAAYGFRIVERTSIPPQDLVPPRSSKHLPYPEVIDPEDPPIRPERHIPDSIATLRRRLSVALAQKSTPMPVLQETPRQHRHEAPFMTQ